MCLFSIWKEGLKHADFLSLVGHVRLGLGQGTFLRQETESHMARARLSFCVGTSTCYLFSECSFFLCQWPSGTHSSFSHKRNQSPSAVTRERSHIDHSFSVS